VASAADVSAATVDLDVVNYSAGDQWTLIEHSGRRVETSASSTVSGDSRVASSAKGDECCLQTSSSDVFVTFNYGFKLRKKIGPSLLNNG
jgi:hypothetical protein